MLKTETVSLLDEYKGIRQIIKHLDPTNIKILSAMWKFGPRNLLEVSRRTGMPFTSVYHRISRIETKSKEIAFLIPQVAKLGMVRIAVLLTARPGCEDEVTEALKTPNLWRSIGFCEGIFTHISIQLVPIKFLRSSSRTFDISPKRS
jgi:DNA-binding Lrp family transcriptional regulator